jgi:MATE family multidrug resistance protein
MELLRAEKATTSPIVELLTLAAPTVAQMASYTVMQFIDTLMLSRVGETEATAGGNAGLFSFSIISFGVGVLFVVNTLASQSFGRREFAECGRYLWQGIWFALLASGFFIALMPLAERAFVLMGHEPMLAADEGIYLRIALAGSVFKLVAVALGQFLLATDRPGSVLASTIAGVGANAVAAWMLIFGHCGFSRMGIAGSARGQNAGVAVEAATCLFFVLRPEPRRLFNALDFKLRTAQMLTLLRVGIPSGVQIIADVLAWSLFGMWVMGQFGKTAMAAQTFMMRYMVVSFMPAFGMGTAVTALVGRYIGRGEPETAAARARLGFTITAIYMVTCGLVFYFGRYPFMRLFTIDPEVVRIGATMLVFAAVYQFFDAVYIVYNGALRGAGDTFVPAIATGVLCWGITVLGGYVTARLFPAFGPAGPWTVATCYGVILGVFMYGRFARGAWRSIHLEGSGFSEDQLGGLRF